MSKILPFETPSQMRARIAELTIELEQHRLKSGGGDGTSGGMSDDWKESVDRQLGQLHGDVRALLNRGVVAVVALAAMIGGLYVRTDEKFEKVSDRLAAVEAKMERIDEKIDTLLARTQNSDQQPRR